MGVRAGVVLNTLINYIIIMVCTQCTDEFDKVQREYRDYVKAKNIQNTQVLGAWAAVKIMYAMPRGMIYLLGKGNARCRYAYSQLRGGEIHAEAVV